MKTLILMRHAKSSWSDPGAEDHDRKLNKRGRNSAKVMAKWLTGKALRPDTLLISSSRRTCETAELMRKAADWLPKPQIFDALYHSSAGIMQQLVAQLPKSCKCALLIAHEPGMSGYLHQLGGPPTGAAQAGAYSHFPTAAIAVLEADIDKWADINASSTNFTEFVKPRDLM